MQFQLNCVRDVITSFFTLSGESGSALLESVIKVLVTRDLPHTQNDFSLTLLQRDKVELVCVRACVRVCVCVCVSLIEGCLRAANRSNNR